MKIFDLFKKKTKKNSIPECVNTVEPNRVEVNRIKINVNVLENGGLVSKQIEMGTKS